MTVLITFLYLFFYRPIEIGMEVLKLVKEESAHGQILMISKNKGIYDHKFQWTPLVNIMNSKKNISDEK